MTQPSPRPLSVILDFDGTITVEDIGDKVVQRFASPGWEGAYQKLLSGELAIREAWAIEAAHLNGSHEPEMVQYALVKAQIRNGLPEFLEYANANGIAVEVASSGFHFYVDAILQKAGMSSIPRARPTVQWDGSGAGVLSFDKGLRDCASTALCKCDRVWSQRRRGRRVAFVGDGLSDVCVASQADILLARGKLAELAPTLDVPYRTFKDFFDVRREIEELLAE